MLFFFILNNKVVIQRFRPQATLSHLSASLKRAVWENPVLKCKRPGAIITSLGPVAFWASVSPTAIEGFWTLTRNGKWDSYAWERKKMAHC